MKRARSPLLRSKDPSTLAPVRTDSTVRPASKTLRTSQSRAGLAGYEREHRGNAIGMPWLNTWCCTESTHMLSWSKQRHEHDVSSADFLRHAQNTTAKWSKKCQNGCAQSHSVGSSKSNSATGHRAIPARKSLLSPLQNAEDISKRHQQTVSSRSQLK